MMCHLFLQSLMPYCHYLGRSRPAFRLRLLTPTHNNNHCLPADAEVMAGSSTSTATTIDVYSLDDREQHRVAKALRKSFGDAAIVSLPPTLRRSELKGIKLRGDDRQEDGSSAGMILLCHYNEGRVLLTDEDGMYNDFIMEACRITGGNVFVALAPVSTAATALANETLVTALAYTGGQQGLLSIHMQKRFLTWDKAPSDIQLDFLRNALEGQMDPLEVPESVLQYSGGRKLTGLSFCGIL